MTLDFERFRSLIPIASLEEKSLNLLARQIELKDYDAGSVIFKAGANDPYTFYLMSGEITLRAADGREQSVESGEEQGLHALASLKPRKYSAIVSSAKAQILRVNADLLDRLLTLQWEKNDANKTGVSVNEIEDDATPEDSAWMMSILQNKTLLRLPPGHIQLLFETLEEMPVKAGDVVIQQGEPGDYYYLIREGTAEVTRQSGAMHTKLAQLESPQSFGEEALLSDQARNATITMKTDGLLMRLSKKDFESLLEQPTLKQVGVKEANALVKNGTIPVDVRTEGEFEESGLKGALNVPLYLVRLYLPKLDKKRKYLLYCDTGARSTAAAFIMSQKGFQVFVLKNGLKPK